MLREMRRFKQQLTEEKCIEILKKEPRGVLSVLGKDGYPYGLPINFVYDDEDGKIYFHCAKSGYKIDSIKAYDKVSLCVYDSGFRKEGDWALNIQSVIAFGRIELVSDHEKTVEKLRKLGLKYYPTAEGAEKEVRDSEDHVQILELTVDAMTGKLVNES